MLYLLKDYTNKEVIKNETKKLIVTIINIVIFVGNAIISFIGNGGDVSTVATIGGALLTGATLI